MFTSFSEKPAAAQPLSAVVKSLIPSGYKEVSRRLIEVDLEPAELIRFQPENTLKPTPGGEHFSIIIGNRGCIKGFTHMDASFYCSDLPSQEEAKKASELLLAIIAPDLLNNMELHWIKPHNETITLTRGETNIDITIPGMKVKMRNRADGRWFWVVVGSDRQAITFERDIVWINFPGHRKTEKWLHDAWLIKNVQ